MEPAQASDMTRLVEGLRLLNRADPFVEVGVGGREECMCCEGGMKGEASTF